MKCYYEELGVERDANLSEIKIAYRKLALMWHPDKNIDCMREAKERFQLIQQAYEVLSDPQERAWYDNHREQILRGKNSEYEDNCLDVFQYFTVSCFMGYGDDEKGFYAVYREVFKKISTEDAEFMECEEELINTPTFGDSKSSYEEVVGPFYAYWSAYCTKRTYAWLCPYDIREIKDRKILREIAKDMKKVVQKAKKERNDAVRNLVAFVRKRDKRVLAYKKLLEERSARNKQKHAQNRLEQIKRRQQELAEMIQKSGATNDNDDYQERLRLLEQQYSSDDEHLEGDDLVLQESYEVYDELYCVACNKDFKTERAFANHEISRKHRDNIERLKIEMQSEEDTYHQDENSEKKEEIDIEAKEEDNTNTSECEQEINKTKFSKGKKKNDIKKTISPTIDQDIHEQNVEAVAENFYLLDNTDEDDEDWSTTKRKFNKKVKCKNKENKHNLVLLEKQYSNTKVEVKYASKSAEKPVESESEITQHICATCKTKFESKNKLFAHLKLLNHGVFIPKAKALSDNTKSKKSKGKRNS